MGARGADAALEQADVVLMHDRLENFLAAFRLSQRARRIIRQNLVISFGTVVILVVFALAGTNSPDDRGRRARRQHCRRRDEQFAPAAFEPSLALARQFGFVCGRADRKPEPADNEAHPAQRSDRAQPTHVRQREHIQ